MPSLLAKSVKQSLTSVFPNTLIKQEEYISYKGCRLFFDFFLPAFNLYIEVQGVQHEKFSPHFHGDASNFKAAKKRDRLKEEWCQLNDAVLVRIDHDEIPIGATDLLTKIEQAQNGPESTE